MAANIFIYCPPAEDGPSWSLFEVELEAFFDGAAEDCGAGAGIAGFNLDCEIANGVDPHGLADRLKPFLMSVGVVPGTFFTVYSDGWEPGKSWRRVEVFGEDRWLSDANPHT